MAAPARSVTDLTQAEFTRAFNAALAERVEADHSVDAWRDELGEREAMRMLGLGSTEAVDEAQQQLSAAEARLERMTRGVQRLKGYPQALGSR
jgi:hypothetical protein